MKDLNSCIKSRKIHLKSFPGTKASHQNHYIKPTYEYKYDCAIIYAGIYYILRNKSDTDMNSLPDIILEVPNNSSKFQH